MYKVVLDGGEMVAIKRDKQGLMQCGSELKKEVELMSQVHHKNLVTLIGIYILEFLGGLPAMLFHLQTRTRQVYCPD